MGSSHPALQASRYPRVRISNQYLPIWGGRRRVRVRFCRGNAPATSSADSSMARSLRSQRGASPSKFEFDPASGSLESAEGPVAITGSLKAMGFEGGEIVRANNP
jgi:hypothetical protein